MNTHTPSQLRERANLARLHANDDPNFATSYLMLAGKLEKEAALIEAAPDLLAALQAALDLLTDGDAEPSDADRVTAIVRNAIARATGAV